MIFQIIVISFKQIQFYTHPSVKHNTIIDEVESPESKKDDKKKVDKKVWEI